MNTSIVSVKSRTTVTTTGAFNIECFSDLIASENHSPNIYRSEVLTAAKTIDNTTGIEGELMISVKGGDASLDTAGELTVGVDSPDDVTKYNKSNSDLDYDG